MLAYIRPLQVSSETAPLKALMSINLHTIYGDNIHMIKKINKRTIEEGKM